MDCKMFHSLLPEYGGSSAGIFCCGSGNADDIKGDTAENSYMEIIDETDADAFLAYCETLADEDFACVFHRDEKSGLYRQYTKNGMLFYLYYIFSEKRTRIILDRASDAPEAFAADDSPAYRTDSCLMQFGLYYSRMIRGITCDCGMLYAIRLRNNELIIIDGGEVEQATDCAVAECLARLRALTGCDRLTVAAWFCTHAHNDHMDFFAKLLRVCGDTMAVKRVIYNFPSHQAIAMEPYVSRLRERVARYCPQARFWKPHTGQKLRIANAEFDVMLTHEDILSPTAEKKYPGMNETSTVMKITVDGVSTLFLADIPEINGDMLCDRYAPCELQCAFLQAAHHCINRIERVYATVKADYVLIPEGREVLNWTHYDVIRQFNAEENILLAGDGTRVFFLRDGRVTETADYPVVGGAYDDSEI